MSRATLKMIPKNYRGDIFTARDGEKLNQHLCRYSWGMLVVLLNQMFFDLCVKYFQGLIAGFLIEWWSDVNTCAYSDRALSLLPDAISSPYYINNSILYWPTLKWQIQGYIFCQIEFRCWHERTSTLSPYCEICASPIMECTGETDKPMYYLEAFKPRKK